MAPETRGARRCATLLGLGVWREVGHCEEDCPDLDTDYSRVVEEMDRTAEGEGGTWLKKDSMRIEVVLVSISVGERKAERGLGSI